MKYLDLAIANETIKTTDIKGKEYAEVNQRIKAFRMVYPQGTIKTEMLSNENGMCIFKAYIYANPQEEFEEKEGMIYARPVYNPMLLATGTAYEKENSSFINKTSYIENCETSAIGRALGMAGFGIDVSVASAEEVQNAINNQTLTEEEAKDLTINFGKYSGRTLKEILETDEKYFEWLRDNTTQEQIKQAINLLKPLPSESEQQNNLKKITEIMELVRQTGTDLEDMINAFKEKRPEIKDITSFTDNELDICIRKLREKL